MTVVRTRAEGELLDAPPLLVLDSLTDLLDRAGLGRGPVAATSVGDGHSNFTFLVTRGSERWILRRPPRPPFPASTHDVLREHRILAACVDEPARTPRPVLAVADLTVLGVPFYVMEFIEGAVITRELPEGARGQEARIAEELVTALAEIHAVDWRGCGLENLGRSEGYLQRQLRRFGGLWDGYRTRPIPAIDEAAQRLAASLPESREATLVHGDFRLGNTMFALDVPARLLAVVDWEMATIGDPLADVGYLVATWAQAGDDGGVLLDLGAVTAQPGFPDRDAVATLYEKRTGRPLGALPWYEALACWKSAVLLEGSYRRFREGATSDPFFARLEAGVPELAERAIEALDRWR